MTSILDAVRQQLGPDTIQQLSSTLGADPATTSNAVSLALPTILGALSRNASQPEGAAALDNALNAHDGSILDNLGGLLGSGGGGGGGIGGAILGHVFGGRRDTVEQGVGRASGLDGAQVAQLMAMLAPIVMGVLGRMKQTKGLDANRLPDVLQQSRAQAEEETPGLGGLGGLLDGNNDGSVADDLLRMGTSALGGMFGNKR
ncbi:MAG TPA: DUF937 domain-containing protein [Thermoanaerobaculia bacterium]|jgi:hypothetical protein|nr:DUF937 domain-containing protein [Thermoanaerobaculia bacterium]